MAVFLPPPSPARHASSEPGNPSKRKAHEFEASPSGTFSFPWDYGHKNIEKHIDNLDEFVVLCIPKELATSLQKFLDSSAKSLPNLKLNAPVPECEEDSVFDPDLANEFGTTFGSIKSEFSNILSKYKDIDLIKNVNSDRLQEFRSIRSTLSKWFVTGQRLLNKLSKPLAKSNEYIKLGFNFSPAVTDENIKNDVKQDIQSFKEKCEARCTNGVIDYARQRNYDAGAILAKVLESNDADLRFLIAKAYRCVVKYNHNLSHNQSSDRRPVQRSYNQAPQEHRRRPPSDHQPYRDARPLMTLRPAVHSDEMYKHRRSNDAYRQYGNENYQEYRQNNNDYLEHRQFGNDNYHERRRRNDSFDYDNSDWFHRRNDYNYDKDFAPYDRNVKQIKERYRKPSTQGRHPSESTAFNWV
jgi:hypothetical protein